MALSFHPKLGLVLVCDYTTGFILPKMVNRRPVVVISPRLRHRANLCTVVPLSTTTPERWQDYHCSITVEEPLPKPWDAEIVWVEADMIATMSFKRLELVRGPKDSWGNRIDVQRNIVVENLAKIRRCILSALGFIS